MEINAFLVLLNYTSPIIDVLTLDRDGVLQGFLQSNEVHIFGYARTKISDDELRNRIRG